VKAIRPLAENGATVRLSRLQRAWALCDLGRAPAARIGIKKARVALAHKLAVRLHRL
jgi:hypothetical protein